MWTVWHYDVRKDVFARQLYAHCTSVEVFQDLVHELENSNAGAVPDLDRAALTYLALAIDKFVDYSSLSCHWHANREVTGHTFHRHDFFFKYATAEMVPTSAGLGNDWVLNQVGKCLGELIDLLEQSSDGKLQFTAPRPKPVVSITCTSADSLPMEDASVDCVVMDPPYYDNVMYAELSDYFYVWLKRTAGLLYPEWFTSYLTDKDREAVANADKFAGQKGGAKNLAGRDYQHRMAAIFKEQRRVLKPDGIMTVMFTHKAAGAWDALAGGLIEAGFTITASWPVNTEAESSLHIRERSAARSTIFLVCRVLQAAPASSGLRYWEDVEPTVRQAVRTKVKQFQEAGIGGIDFILRPSDLRCRCSLKLGRLLVARRGRSRRQNKGTYSRSSIHTPSGLKMPWRQHGAK